MKKRFVWIELVILVLFGFGVLWTHLNREVKVYNWHEVVEKEYGLEIIKVYSEQTLDLNRIKPDYLIGFTDDMLTRIKKAATRKYPDQGMEMHYILTDQGEKLVYSYLMLYRYQKPEDFCFIVDHPTSLGISTILSQLGEDSSLQSINDLIAFGSLHLLHADDLNLTYFFGNQLSFIKEKLKEVLFFVLEDNQGLFFSYQNKLYILIKQNDTYSFVLPEVMLIEEFLVFND